MADAAQVAWQRRLLAMSSSRIAVSGLAVLTGRITASIAVLLGRTTVAALVAVKVVVATKVVKMPAVRIRGRNLLVAVGVGNGLG